ncbi:MAG: histidinol-phosphate transaminase [Corynebacterium glucuronolyticum]|nr:histidinol-phosphate transaminase [Corynebacterium glucuronolyticum]MDD7585860.1 histidinol-phosphate transaminase [Mycobacteriaceae bacterium]MDY5833152.1 histidinol-phosphate transaminase [Corynebacterium glucuronolyticum]
MISLPIREDLKGKSPYGAPQLDTPVRLNTNENPYPPSDELAREIGEEAARLAVTLNRYPDRDAVDLRTDLAAYASKATGVDVTVDNVWAANGSNEVLQQLLLVFGGPGRSAMGFTPSYSMHPLLAEGTFTEFIGVPRDDNFDIDKDAALAAIAKHQPDVIFVTTPNNPTGNSTPLDTIRAIVEVAPGIVIVDEAYAEFSDAPSAAVLIGEFPDTLVVSRTMSKAFDFAGGRLGYFMAHPAFIDAVMLVRLPYHLSTLTQAAARAALRHAEETLASVDKLKKDRDQLTHDLRGLGYRVIDSDANFLMISHPCASWQDFLDEGVLIRDNGIDGFLRVTIGTAEENSRFLDAATKVIEHA